MSTCDRKPTDPCCEHCTHPVYETRTAAEERAANVALLRRRADRYDATAAKYEDSAATLEADGHKAANERGKAITYTYVAAALRAAADHIEVGEVW